MAEDSKIIEQSIADTIIERPYGFKVDGRRFYLYPITLGKTYLLSRIMERLSLNQSIININPYLEALRLVNEKTEDACRLITYHTIKDKDELFDNDFIEERIDYLATRLSKEELAQLLIIILTPENLDVFLKHLKIDKEKEDMAKVMKCKKDSGNSYSFGGKSIYGSMIDYLAQRYGWTLDYIVWGISYNNIKMLLADVVTSIHLTDEEKKKCRVSNDRNFISGDDINNIEKIKKMFGG